MPKAGEIRYCPELGGEATDAAFVWIPPGSFWMGDKENEDKNPVHFVVISKGFWLQQTLLTIRQYSGKNSDSPQTNIYWDNIFNFCRGKSLRMPTEAEWEYAARSNTGHKYLFTGSNVANNVAWTEDNSNGYIRRVGQLKPNSRELFDMSGNVWEWCRDWDGESGSTAPKLNPTGPATGDHRVYRGGSWSDNTDLAKVYFSDFGGQTYRTSYHGVRLIWEPKNA